MSLAKEVRPGVTADLQAEERVSAQGKTAGTGWAKAPGVGLEAGGHKDAAVGPNATAQWAGERSPWLWSHSDGH